MREVGVLSVRFACIAPPALTSHVIFLDDVQKARRDRKRAQPQTGPFTINTKKHRSPVPYPLLRPRCASLLWTPRPAFTAIKTPAAQLRCPEFESRGVLDPYSGQPHRIPVAAQPGRWVPGAGVKGCTSALLGSADAGQSAVLQADSGLEYRGKAWCIGEARPVRVAPKACAASLSESRVPKYGGRTLNRRVENPAYVGDGDVNSPLAAALDPILRHGAASGKERTELELFRLAPKIESGPGAYRGHGLVVPRA